MTKPKNIKYEWFKNKQNLSEAYQSVKMKFSLVSKEDPNIIKQAHPWVQCRDYLHDAIRSQLHGIKSQIFGFIYDPEDDMFPPINLTKTYLLISQQTITDIKKYRKDLTNALTVIHYYENLMGVENSTLKKVPMTYCKDLKIYNHVWLFEGDVFWLSTPYMISMLTFLLRLGCKLPKNKIVGDPEKIFKTLVDKYEKECEEGKANGKIVKKDNDLTYLKSCYNKLSTLIQLKDNLIDIHGKDVFSALYDVNTPISSFHNNSGILSTCNGKTWNSKFNKIINGAFSK